MVCKQYPRCLTHGLAFFGLFLTLTSAASAEWNEKVLYSFQGGADGATPAGGVVFDKQGNLYGATQQGGGSNCSPMAACGTVYQLAPPAKPGDPWTETLLHVFRGKQYNDGEFPSGGVIADAAGNIYGTTAYGGAGDCVLLGIKGGCGTVFELSPPQTKGEKWTYTILYSFPTAKQGYVPAGDLVFDSAGNLYGATIFGGGRGTTCDGFYGGNCGAVFELSPPKTKGGKWTEKVLHSFAGGTDGANPNGGLVLDVKGAVYGTTTGGGFNCAHHSGQGCGTIFQLSPPTVKAAAWTEKQLLVFKNGNDGGQPIAGVILADGFLYGGAGGGAKGGGIVFKLTTSGEGRWQETILYGFSSNSYGYSPATSLFDSGGSLYGTTYVGPGSLAGSVFRLKPPSQKDGAWAASVLYGFSGGTDGRFPTSVLIFDGAGNLYGATQEGGGKGTCSGYCGTVFELAR